MDPRSTPALLGPPMQNFLHNLADAGRGGGFQTHFVTAREMTNLILAACDEKNGDPCMFRDYAPDQIGIWPTFFRRGFTFDQAKASKSYAFSLGLFRCSYECSPIKARPHGRERQRLSALFTGNQLTTLLF